MWIIELERARVLSIRQHFGWILVGGSQAQSSIFLEIKESQEERLMSFYQETFFSFFFILIACLVSFFFAKSIPFIFLVIKWSLSH